MRKIIMLMHISLDGYVATADGNMDWIQYNQDVADFAYSLHSSTDTAIYGRVTYEMMEGYWPNVLNDPKSAGDELAHAQWADKATKILVSNTVESADWNNTIIFSGNIPQQIEVYKQQSGKDIWLLGSPSVTQLLMKHNLIDEYRLTVTPVILGGGKKLFAESSDVKRLKLIDSKVFADGVLGLIYAPDKTSTDT